MYFPSARNCRGIFCGVRCRVLTEGCLSVYLGQILRRLFDLFVYRCRERTTTLIKNTKLAAHHKQSTKALPTNLSEVLLFILNLSEQLFIELLHQHIECCCHKQCHCKAEEEEQHIVCVQSHAFEYCHRNTLKNIYAENMSAEH